MSCGGCFSFDVFLMVGSVCAEDVGGLGIISSVVLRGLGETVYWIRLSRNCRLGDSATQMGTRQAVCPEVLYPPIRQNLE